MCVCVCEGVCIQRATDRKSGCHFSLPFRTHRNTDTKLTPAVINNKSAAPPGGGGGAAHCLCICSKESRRLEFSPHFHGTRCVCVFVFCFDIFHLPTPPRQPGPVFRRLPLHCLKFAVPCRNLFLKGIVNLHETEVNLKASIIFYLKT